MASAGSYRLTTMGIILIRAADLELSARCIPFRFIFTKEG